MKKHLGLIFVVVLVAAVGGASFPAASHTAADTPSQGVAIQIIAREKAAFEAWQRKDKAFYADYWADDFTEFLPHSPYLGTDPKANLLPRFEQLTERWKIVDFQMYNPRVQVYGDVAVLTYTESVEGRSDGQPVSYTGKATMVYVKQGATWRGVHYHESANPAGR